MGTKKEIKAKLEFYESKLKNYSKLLELSKDQKTPKLEELIKRINETFADKIYTETAGLNTQYEVLEQAWEEKKIDFITYMETAGKIKTQMSKLEVHYNTKVHSWMTDLKKEVENISKQKSISEQTLQEATEIIEQLKIKDYYTKSHAVFIGINDYENENPLKNAVSDARAVRDVLIDNMEFENPIELYDEDATKDNMQHIFEDQLQNGKIIGANDRVLVYYSGHGKLRDRGMGKDNKPLKQGYVLPVNAQKQNWSSCIKMDDVVQACRDCPAKHVLLVLDCCYAGAASRDTSDRDEIGDRTVQQYLSTLTSKTAIQVIAAGQDDEQVNDDSIIRGHSPFTAALLEVIEKDKDTDNDGLLTASEIGPLVRSTVLRYLGNNASLSQTPTFGSLPGSRNGDFVFKIFPTRKKPIFKPFTTR